MKYFLLVLFLTFSFNSYADDGITVEIIPNPDHEIAEGEAYGIVNAPIERIWEVLLDYDNCKEWMPSTIESEYRGQDSQDRDLVYFVMSLSLYGTRDMLNAYTKVDKPFLKRLSYEKVGGSFEYGKGYTILRKKSADSTLVLIHTAGKSGLDLPYALNIEILKSTLRRNILNLRKYLSCE